MIDLEQRIIDALTTKFGDRFRNTPDRSEGIPIIDDSTRYGLMKILNLGLSPANIPAEEPWYPPYTLAVDMALDEFAMLANAPATEGFMTATNSWITSTFRNPDSANCATVGIALVLKAFHLQIGPKFIDRLAAVPAGDVLSLFTLKGNTGDRELLVQQAGSDIIPPYQYNLRFCADKLGVLSPDRRSFQNGTHAAYGVLSAIWDGKP